MAKWKRWGLQNLDARVRFPLRPPNIMRRISNLIAILFVLIPMAFGTLWPTYKYPLLTVVAWGVSATFIVFGLEVIRDSEVYLHGILIQGMRARYWGVFLIIVGFILGLLFTLGKMDYFHTTKLDFERLVRPPEERIIINYSEVSLLDMP